MTGLLVAVLTILCSYGAGLLVGYGFTAVPQIAAPMTLGIIAGFLAGQLALWADERTGSCHR